MEPNQPDPNQPLASPEQAGQVQPTQGAEPAEEGTLKSKEKLLFSWTAPERPFKRRSKEFFTTVLAIAFLVSVIGFVIEGPMTVAVVIAVVFLVYVLSTVPPQEIENKITNRGIYFGHKRHFWEEFTRFWITHRFDNQLLVLESIFMPGRVEMVILPQDKEKIQQILEDYLPYEEAEPGFFDKTAAWLSKRIPLEG